MIKIMQTETGQTEMRIAQVDKMSDGEKVFFLDHKANGYKLATFHAVGKRNRVKVSGLPGCFRPSWVHPGSIYVPVTSPYARGY